MASELAAETPRPLIGFKSAVPSFLLSHGPRSRKFGQALLAVFLVWEFRTSQKGFKQGTEPAPEAPQVGTSPRQNLPVRTPSETPIFKENRQKEICSWIT